MWLVFPSDAVTTVSGIILAMASGAIASGIGYAIWYAILPKLDASLAAILQLTVPIIALAGGMVFLSEAVTWTFVVSAVLILGGVFIAILGPNKTK